MKPQEFIDWLLPAAKEIEAQTGLNAGIVVSQAALETGWGKYICHDMNTMAPSNNLFNIKVNKSWPGQHVDVLTTEYLTREQMNSMLDGGTHVTPLAMPDVNGKIKCHVVAKFKAYPSTKESFSDYVALISGAKRYEAAWATRSKPLLYAKNLQSAGYATDPKYADGLIATFKAHFSS